MIMNVIKGGLLSNHTEVANLCARLIAKVSNHFVEKGINQGVEASRIVLPLLYDWFVVGHKQ